MSKPKLVMASVMLDQLGLDVGDMFDVIRVHDMDAQADALAAVADEVAAMATGGHGLHVDGAMMDRFPNLKIISNFGVGYDAIDATAAGERDVIVTNTPDVLTEEVADTTLGLLIMTVRELGRAEQYLRAGKWGTDGDYPLTGMSLRDRSIGIVGLGRIGAAIATRCAAFGMPISYFSRTRKDDQPYTYYSDLKDMAAAVDTLIVITPGTAETQNMINAEVLSALGTNGVVINVARGSVVDETALITALKDGTIKAAGLDVMWNEPKINKELMMLDNCVLLPHVGSASLYTRRAMGQLVIDNLRAMVEGAPPLTPVPETPFTGWKG
ncbi:MAG: 2-hydroxyacid dehydrogenase [Pseudomonadota bacterium]